MPCLMVPTPRMSCLHQLRAHSVPRLQAMQQCTTRGCCIAVEKIRKSTLGCARYNVHVHQPLTHALNPAPYAS